MSLTPLQWIVPVLILNWFWFLKGVFYFHCVWQSLSCVRLFVSPWTIACQAPLSMEFFRQEYWSGWSEVKWKLLSRVRLFAILWTIQSMGFSRPEYWSGLPSPSPGGSSQPKDWTQVSCIAGGFFTNWATREAQEYCNGLSNSPQKIFLTQGSNPPLLCLLHFRQILYHGATSCSLFQGIFPTQGSIPGLPHCRLILYCLSHRVTTYTQSSLFFLKHMPWRLGL